MCLADRGHDLAPRRPAALLGQCLHDRLLVCLDLERTRQWRLDRSYAIALTNAFSSALSSSERTIMLV